MMSRIVHADRLELDVSTGLIVVEMQREKPTLVGSHGQAEEPTDEPPSGKCLNTETGRVNQEPSKSRLIVVFSCAELLICELYISERD